MSGFTTVKNGVTDVDELWRYAAHLEAKIARLRAALEWYASGSIAAAEDGGKRAREALQSQQKEGGNENSLY